MKVFVSGTTDALPLTFFLEGSLIEILDETTQVYFNRRSNAAETDDEDVVIVTFKDIIEESDEEFSGNPYAPLLISIVNVNTGEIIYSGDNIEESIIKLN